MKNYEKNLEEKKNKAQLVEKKYDSYSRMIQNAYMGII